MEQARQAMDAVQSYRFTGDINNVQGEEIQNMRLTGEWASPRDYRLEARNSGSLDSYSQEFV